MERSVCCQVAAHPMLFLKQAFNSANPQAKAQPTRDADDRQEYSPGTRVRRSNGRGSARSIGFGYEEASAYGAPDLTSSSYEHMFALDRFKVKLCCISRTVFVDRDYDLN